ncbi:MAG: hypothetical protein U0X20_28835 [Caldilineaceae bacterium]
MSELAIELDGETRYYPIDHSEPGWNGSLRLIIRVRRPFDLGTYPAVFVEANTRIPGSFAASLINPSLEQMHYGGSFWPDK